MKYCVNNLNGDYTKDDFCFFWGHTPSKDGKIAKTCLSQWWICEFAEDKLTFCCAEQYMMYKKALLFNDLEYAQKIIECNVPKKMKEYGRLIRGLDGKIWNEHKFDIVLRGNILKFSQNEDLRDFLLSTGEKIIVEASPYDKIWGIGMRESAENAVIPQKWNGLNLLGFALMETRDEIKN